jgi:norsolorinic acid ketoreductase
LNPPVSGANRGIGLHLIHALLKRLPNAIIFAGARDPSSANALKELASKNGNVHVVKLVVDDAQSNKDAVEEVKKVTNRLDIVVANAGQYDGRLRATD